ncbi:MAG: response regulator [Elusimicrobia bacterium]|nr:response regulator [Elusimicrobiota bacterium]
MNKKPVIMAVDDDPGMLELISGVISSNMDSDIIKAGNGEQALHMLKETVPDLLILDWNMPKIDGWEVCRKVRREEKTRNVPVIMLTARSAKEDEIIGLEVGADDYITKPFNPDILVARIKALLRRFSDESQRELQAGDIYMNLDKHIVKVKGDIVELWPKEFDLLHFFMKKKDNAVTRDSLLENVWGYEYFGTTRTVDVTVKRLRQKLGDEARLIRTVKGIGYKFTEED